MDERSKEEMTIEEAYDWLVSRTGAGSEGQAFVSITQTCSGNETGRKPTYRAGIIGCKLHSSADWCKTPKEAAEKVWHNWINGKGTPA